MEKWIMSIVGVVILTALFELFMVEGETKKYIKGILSVIVIIVIISPLPNLLKKDYSADVFNQEIYDERVYKKMTASYIDWQEPSMTRRRPAWFMS